MTGPDEDEKAVFHDYLQGARDVLLWKLEGLSEYDIRRPITPTGTNLLGLVKHSAGCELGYFGPVFGRPHGVPLPWLATDAAPNADMWATPDQSRDEIVALYRQAWRHADETIAALPLDAPGRVPWWGANGAVTLRHVLVHVTAETQRHAGHADIVRELIDGAAGLLKGSDNLPDRDQAWWRGYRDQLEQAARGAATAGGGPARSLREVSPVADGVGLVQPALEFSVQVSHRRDREMVRNQGPGIG
jgi:Protein of unknown function (DUF664)